ncbi:MAG: hypothetical protein ACI8ZX_003010, partial [Planctomycetota bacterium]
LPPSTKLHSKQKKYTRILKSKNFYYPGKFKG